ncbi:MAG: cyclic lactone autoinducer peptide [Clostridia bacterium]|nr:cyclic lactone autoinducer peptide [Clostridia bacterium]
MLKFISKLAEKYARSTNSACIFWSLLHQPKMPASMIKED